MNDLKKQRIWVNWRRDPNPLPTIAHLWVVVDKNWAAPLDIGGGHWLRGFIYEYEKKGEKNIGMQVVSTKAYNQK